MAALTNLAMSRIGSQAEAAEGRQTLRNMTGIGVKGVAKWNSCILKGKLTPHATPSPAAALSSGWARPAAPERLSTTIPGSPLIKNTARSRRASGRTSSAHSFHAGNIKPRLRISRVAARAPPAWAVAGRRPPPLQSGGGLHWPSARNAVHVQLAMRSAAGYILSRRRGGRLYRVSLSGQLEGVPHDVDSLDAGAARK